MRITKRQLRQIIREEKRRVVEARRSRGIMHIIKKHGGKRLPKKSQWDPTRYEFRDNRTASNVVWEIHAETGRECANTGNIVTMYT